MVDLNRLHAKVVSQGKGAEEQVGLILRQKALYEMDRDEWRQYLSMFDEDVQDQLLQQQDQPLQQQPSWLLPAGKHYFPIIMLGWPWSRYHHMPPCCRL